MRILIVDDDDISLRMLHNALEQVGHDVFSAHDGDEALDLLDESGCRLVISDWEMPRMSGVDLCRRIRDRQAPGYVYVILLTARSQAVDVVDGLSAGADDFVTKPFNPAELQVRVRAGERVLSLETRDVAIFAMAKLAESRDSETGMHLERMRTYAHILATTLMEQGRFAGTICPEYVRTIFLTSPLHDIGKVAIPDSVLLKPGRLSDEEFEIMKTHTTAGAETLDAAARQFPGMAYLRMARDIALTHHERYDGTGYPQRLAGDDIPLCGRIVALADVYDALTSRRVYKQAFSHVIARNLVLEESNSHFDPLVVEAFLVAEERFKAVRTQFQETPLAAVS